MEDLISDIPGADAVTGAAAVGASWISTQFNWWKNSDSKLVKIGVPLAIFVGVALILSVIQS